jgi:glucose-6-phosphate 1-dehydrogenase
MLFTSSREVLDSWKAVMPFINKSKRVKLNIYNKKTKGPREADRFLIRDKSEWYGFKSSCPLH